MFNKSWSTFPSPSLIKHRLIQIGQQLINFFTLLFRRQSTRSVVLLFTDGQSNRNSAQTKERTKELRATGAEVFTVSLDKEIDLEELYSVATSFQHVIQVIIHLLMSVCVACTICFRIKISLVLVRKKYPAASEVFSFGSILSVYQEWKCSWCYDNDNLLDLSAHDSHSISVICKVMYLIKSDVHVYGN